MEISPRKCFIKYLRTKGSSPISARLYGGLQTHGIHSKDHAIMDRAWNTFTQRILDPFHPSYTWYNEISTDTNRYLFLLFSPFLRGMITFAPTTALFSHSWDSSFFLGDWNLKNATTRIFHASFFYQSPKRPFHLSKEILRNVCANNFCWIYR